jgi:hypothetical protein
VNRPFTKDDDGKYFRATAGAFFGEVGRLEFPLQDPGSAKEGEGIVWFKAGRWDYFRPEHLEEA